MRAPKLEHFRTRSLSIACELSGSAQGRPTFLLHGWPDDARTWDRVLPALHAAGHRTIVPYLRGCGPTRFRSPETPRNGQLAALGQDVLDLADAMELRSFAVVGHDWGALHPAAQGKRQEFPHGHLGVLQHVMHHRDGAEVVDGDADTFQGLAQRRVHVLPGARDARHHPEGM